MCVNLEEDEDPRSLVTRLVHVFVVRSMMSQCVGQDLVESLYEGLDRVMIQVCLVKIQVCQVDWVKIQECLNVKA